MCRMTLPTHRPHKKTIAPAEIIYMNIASWSQAKNFNFMILLQTYLNQQYLQLLKWNSFTFFKYQQVYMLHVYKFLEYVNKYL